MVTTQPSAYSAVSMSVPARATAYGPHEMLTLLEEELTNATAVRGRRPALFRHRSRVIAASSGAVAIGDLRVQPMSAALI
jgi:hypothetical protein